ncbi:probable receptor-like protein kinase At2g21480 [Medicago truncatula]|uniref:probable receptor-like protein kinase At2g21480 n=1 Tax=Medicago truncatula TaxID=3880 RepID=UPI0019671481|nr:probable receptor-like protein kinase At2g21480 [Medicago truncatula]
MKIEPLTWKQRLKICIGAACGVHYLHTGTKHFWTSLQGPLFTDSMPKPKSILSDNIIGSYGYVAPEILENNKVTDKCDVYSFGNILLEVVCLEKLENVETKVPNRREY